MLQHPNTSLPHARFRLLTGLLLGAMAFSAGLQAQESTATPAAETPSPPAAAAQAAPPADTVKVLVHTSLGDIQVSLAKDRAPVTVANFLRYVDHKRFDGSEFYRAVKIGSDGKYGLVQGGLRGNPKRVYKPIAHESPLVTGLSHLNGAISMARTNPGTATADFFIVVGDLTALDGKAGSDDPGYAVFGQVTEGMDVVREVLEQPTSVNAGDGAMKGQMIASPIKILSVRRIE